jgi:paraquat-inducible protein B
MSNKGNTAVIGAFVVGALVLAVAGILTFGSGMLFSEKKTYVMYFDGDLKGLNVGAPVAFRGVRVGEVTDISVYIESEPLQFIVPVMAEIDSRRFHQTGGSEAASNSEADLKTLIAKGLRAQLSLQSIVTGQLMIQLDFYPGTPAKLKGSGETPEIPTLPSGFERLTQALEKISFRELVDNVNLAVKQIGSILDKNEIQKTLSSIRTAADDMAVLARHLDQEATPLIDSLKRTSDDAGRLIQGADRKIDPLMADVQASLEAMRQAADQARQSLQSIDLLSESYTERSAFHYELSNALKEIAAAASSLKALTDMLQQQPDALIRGKGEPGGQ